MKPSTEKFTALAIFDPYNEYGYQADADTDDSPNEAERDQWDDFTGALADEWRRPPSHITSDSDSAHYGKCDVTGLYGDCVTFTAVWM